MTRAPRVTIQRKEVGASPASLVHVGERHVAEFRVQVTSYDEKTLETTMYSSAASMPDFSQDCRVWIQVIGLHELYFTTTSHRMNEVMKILASISAIFLPLTFLAGMYGMNFDVMPELHWKWGYPALLLIFVSVGLFLVRFFRKKGWL